MRVLTLVMAKSLAVGSGLIDTLGMLLSAGMDHWWEADDAVLDLIRSRDTLLAMLEEVGGKAVADAYNCSGSPTTTTCRPRAMAPIASHGAICEASSKIEAGPDLALEHLGRTAHLLPGALEARGR